MPKPIYLDHNATTPLDEEVKGEIIRCLDLFGNPSSIHTYGAEAKAVIEKARELVASLINCSSDEVYFTSGGTESNNLAIFGIALKKGSGHIITSSIEHPAVLNPLKRLQDMGFRVTYLPVDSRGVVDPEDLKRAIQRDTILITIMHSNNETGMLQPISEIAKIANQQSIPLHTDASQSVGKVPVDVRALGVDLLTIAGHKFYAPKGVGALYVKRGLEIKPFMLGAGHERGLRPGTENTIGIAGLAKACEIAKRDLSLRISHNQKLTSTLYEALSASVSLRVNGSLEGRLPNTLNVSLKGVSGNKLVTALKDKVALSAGSACHAGVCKPSYVLKAMGLSDESALSAIRISTGKDNSIDEIHQAVDLIKKEIDNCSL